MTRWVFLQANSGCCAENTFERGEWKESRRARDSVAILVKSNDGINVAVEVKSID